MIDPSFNHNTNQPDSNVDYTWFKTYFDDLTERIASLEHAIDSIDQGTSKPDAPPRKYYSVPEFAELVERREYTVREWCRLYRINAEKCDSGRGDTKSWKIPCEELQRYRDHGLLPQGYLR